MTTIPEIRARHEGEAMSPMASARREQFPKSYYTVAHADRAALLAHLDAMAGALRKAKYAINGREHTGFIDEVLKQSGYGE